MRCFHPIYSLSMQIIIVPAPNSALIQQEDQQWANDNNLKLNSSKSCEMVVHLPTNKSLNLPPLVPNLTRVDQITALYDRGTCMLTTCPGLHSTVRWLRFEAVTTVLCVVLNLAVYKEHFLLLSSVKYCN